MTDIDRSKRPAALEWVLPIVGIVSALAISFGLGTVAVSTSRSSLQSSATSHSPQQGSDGANGTAAKGDGSAEGYKAYPDRYSRDCYYAKDHDSADLCAQWRAALAAEDAVIWTQYGFWLGAFGGLLSAVGLGLVLLSLRQTERSLAQTRDANSIARLGMRPWLTMDDLKVDWVQIFSVDDTWYLTVSVEAAIVNSGGVPAKDVKVRCDIFDYSDQPVFADRVFEMSGTHVELENGFYQGIIGPSARGKFHYCPQVNVDDRTEDGASRRDIWPAVVFSVIYKSVAESELFQTVQIYRLAMGQDDNNTAVSTAFWLDDFKYDDVYVGAGSAMDRAT